MSKVRRKVFISYHHTDQREVDEFVEKFSSEERVFIVRAVGMTDDVINSTDTDYVMRRIRELYLRDSTVTAVLIGRCTWARRYVDWEIQSSLRYGETVTPNGLVGIVIPSAGESPIAPNRLRINLRTEERDGYARWYWYPSNSSSLMNMIEEAFNARTVKPDLIVNPRERFGYNRSCP